MSRSRKDVVETRGAEVVLYSHRPDQQAQQSSAALGQVLAWYADGRGDLHVIRMWLHGKAPGTQKWYAREAYHFLTFVGRGLPSVTIYELQAYAERLCHLAESTQVRKLSALKSLFSYATKIGYLERNWAGMLKLPKVYERLTERILSEEDLQRMIELEEDLRNLAMLRLFYSAGLRVSELCAARWGDLAVRLDSRNRGKRTVQLTVFGKGRKTRTVLLSAAVWQVLEEIRPLDAQPEDAIFTSYNSYKKGRAGRRRPLNRKTAWRIVRAAAERAGLDQKVSPHWLWHAHASHALDRGAPIHLVQKTLGHESLATTSRYAHARPNECSSMYLAA